MSKFAFLIPSYNEAKTLPRLISKLKSLGEVILINDNSTDETLKKIKKFKINIINNDYNIGYDKSLAKGFYLASLKKFKYIMTVDADGEHTIEDIKKFINMANNYNPDIILGVRDYKPRVSEYIMNYFALKKFGIKDCLCGLKVFRKNLVKLSKINNYESINTELLFFLMKTKKIKLRQIPIKIKKRTGKNRFGGYLDIKGNIKIFKSLIIGVKRYFI